MSNFVNLIREYKYEAIALVALLVFLFFFTRSSNVDTKTRYYQRNNRLDNQVHMGVHPDKAIRGSISEDPTRYQNRKELLNLPPINPTHLSKAPVENIRETILTRTPLKPITIAGDP